MNQGAHAPLEERAIFHAFRIIRSAMDHGWTGTIDVPAEIMPTPELCRIASISRDAFEQGREGFAELIGYIYDRNFSDKDGLRETIARIAEPPIAERPQALESAVNTVRDYCNKKQAQILTWKLNDAMQEGEDPTEIIQALADVDYVPDSIEHAEAIESVSDRILNLPFRLLGHADGLHRYLPDNGMTVVALSASAHTGLNLMQIAPLQAWEMTFPSKEGCKWTAAANALIQSSLAMPQYDPRAIRGRGCWIDGDSVVFHAGNKLAVDGRITPLSAYRSPNRSIYEAGIPIAVDTADALGNAQACRVIELCESLSWDQPLFGKLLAGWMALAPISGALNWRPHIWVTGASGSGKSWIMANIIHQLAGVTAVYVKGNTSEAGIRGRLKSDSLPVLFDEAESENQRAGNRMESVIELARQASSEDGGGIIKGTQTGGSITYMVRSMFCFASIGVAAVKKADTSRIAVLNLVKTNDTKQFEAVKAIWRDTVAKPRYCAQFRARSIRNAITTRHNAEVFSTCAVAYTGDKRSADQIGTLLAGAYSLTSTKPIEPEHAEEWLAKQNWQPYKVEAVDSDENQCLSHLMAGPIRIETSHGPETITISEALQRASNDISPSAEAYALTRIGIKISSDGGSVQIANQHQGLERIFRDTPWAGSKWKGQLLRVEGAICPKSPVRFSPMVIQRAVEIRLLF